MRLALEIEHLFEPDPRHRVPTFQKYNGSHLQDVCTILLTSVASMFKFSSLGETAHEFILRGLFSRAAANN